MKRILSLAISFIMAFTIAFEVGTITSDVYADTDPTASEQSIIYEKTVYVGSGIKQTEVASVDRDLNQHVDYCFEIDMRDHTAGIIAGYRDYNYVHEDRSTWGLQTVTDQVKSAEKATGKNVVGAINGDFYNMSTGEPAGVLIMEGEIKHPNRLNRNFFAVKKDGTAVIVEGGSPIVEGVYECAIGGDIIAVKDGKVTQAALNNSDNSVARAAIGIKADGTVVTFTSGGIIAPIRHGYSLREVGKIMRDRGCVDALIIDGGGSTTFVSKYEGEDKVVPRNYPQDGSQRQVCTTLMFTSTKSPAEDNAALTACEKNGHQYIHDNGSISCKACSYTSGTEGFTGLTQDTVTKKWILFEKGTKQTGFAPYGNNDAYYFDFNGYGNKATLVEKVESDCTTRGYRIYKNNFGEKYELLEVTASGHDYKTIKGKSVCEKCGWTQVDINDCEIKLSATKFGYDGTKKVPSIWMYAPNGKKLSIRKIYNSGDYSATGENNIGIGTATLTFAPLWYYVDVEEDRGTVIGERVVTYKILPQPAANLKIEHPSRTEAVLSWDASPSAGLDYLIEYNIYKKEGTGKWVKIDKTAETKYTVKDLKINTDYSFRVLSTAMGDDGKYYNSWDYASGSTKTINKLTTPTVTVSNVASTGKNIIKWKPIKNATAYAVYRSTSKDGEYKKMITTTKTSCTHTGAVAGAIYYYKVQAVFKTNENLNSDFSQIVSRRCDLARPVVTATIYKKTGKPKLTWKKVTGADKYKIYRATSKYGKYTYMGAVKATSYINKTAKKGRTYWYKVRAVDNDYSSANSAYSILDKIKSK